MGSMEPDRNRKKKQLPFPDDALHPESSLMQFHQMFGDGEGLGLSRGRGAARHWVISKRGFKDLATIFRGDARTTIAITNAQIAIWVVLSRTSDATLGKNFRARCGAGSSESGAICCTVGGGERQVGESTVDRVVFHKTMAGD